MTYYEFDLCPPDGPEPEDDLNLDGDWIDRKAEKGDRPTDGTV